MRPPGLVWLGAGSSGCFEGRVEFEKRTNSSSLGKEKKRTGMRDGVKAKEKWCVTEERWRNRHKLKRVRETLMKREEERNGMLGGV